MDKISLDNNMRIE